jgi:hypothetical protein
LRERVLIWVRFLFFENFFRIGAVKWAGDVSVKTTGSYFCRAGGYRFCMKGVNALKINRDVGITQKSTSPLCTLDSRDASRSGMTGLGGDLVGFGFSGSAFGGPNDSDGRYCELLLFCEGGSI